METNGKRTMKRSVNQARLVWDSEKTFKVGKKTTNVTLGKANVSNWSLLRVILRSKNEKEPFFWSSEVNLIFACLVFR